MTVNLEKFSVFYINFDKVFEIAMLLDNEVVKSEENREEKLHKAKLTARLKSMLSGVFGAALEGGYEYSQGNAIKKTVEIKTTNAIILRDLISAIQKEKPSEERVSEGQLMIIDNVQLELVNEEETRQMKLIKQGLLDKFTQDDISVGELLKSIGEDHSYAITTEKDDIKYLFKIPSEVESEFENKYTIDDLFIGKVSIIGIYKGQTTIDGIKSTFAYLTKNDGLKENDDIIQSNSDPAKEKIPDNSEFKYIDLLAIVQRLSF